MIGVGVAGHTGHVSVRVHSDFVTGFVAITDIIFAYCGHVTFFTFIAEMKRPQDFHKALYALQIFATTLYLVTGIVIYAYTGDKTVSPALGNTGHTLRKIAYGLALPTIIISGVVNAHVGAKLVSCPPCSIMSGIAVSRRARIVLHQDLPSSRKTFPTHDRQLLHWLGDLDRHLRRYVGRGICHRLRVRT